MSSPNKEKEDAVRQRKTGSEEPATSSETNEKEEKKQETSEKSSSSCTEHGLFDRFVESFEEALHTVTEPAKQTSKLSSLSLEGVVEFIKNHKPTNVIVMTGAGISTSAGIPDFRSPGTGLYENLGQYNLSDPMDIFGLQYFLTNPEPFYCVAKKLFPKHIKPTITHHFVRLLERKGILRRWFTQNIDSLEFLTGIPEDRIVEAHGSHRTSTCLKCKKKYDLKWMEDRLRDPDCKVPKCESCDGVVKPDITFFGESLPTRFMFSAINDFPKCDLLIIMGTSLVVQPFAAMVDEVGDDVPRLLINLEEAGGIGRPQATHGMERLCYGPRANTRDVFWQGKCDEGVRKMAELMGWELELDAIVQEAELAYIDRVKHSD